jgi:hypothetical protein
MFVFEIKKYFASNVGIRKNITDRVYPQDAENILKLPILPSTELWNIKILNF